jgi:hypothetical protein
MADGGRWGLLPAFACDGEAQAPQPNHLDRDEVNAVAAAEAEPDRTALGRVKFDDFTKLVQLGLHLGHKLAELFQPLLGAADVNAWCAH